MSFGNWPESLHMEDNQINRRMRSFNDPMRVTSLNKKTKTAIIENSKGDTWYTVTLSSCTCPDFQKRHLPCKHIYKLASVLGYSIFDDRISKKSKRVALLSCIFGGYLGIHYFYSGRILKGLLYFFTVGFFYIGWLYDIYVISSGNFKDSKGAYIR